MNALNLAIIFIASALMIRTIGRFMQTKKKSVKAVCIIHIIAQVLCAGVAVNGLLGG